MLLVLALARLWRRVHCPTSRIWSHELFHTCVHNLQTPQSEQHRDFQVYIWRVIALHKCYHGKLIPSLSESPPNNNCHVLVQELGEVQRLLLTHLR